MATIDSGILNTLGAGSGLDTSSIVTALVDAERAPREAQINGKIEASESKISGLGILSSALSSLSEAFEQLDDPSEFTQHTYVDAKTANFLATTGDSAVPGQYSVSVSQLATSQTTRLFTGYGSGDPVPVIGFDSPTASVNAGADVNLDITIGGNTTALVIENPTAQSVVDAINNEGLGLTARLVDSGAESAPYQIVITGQEGLANAFSIDTNLALAAEDLRSAQNAELTVDGIELVRSSNTIDDAIPGVELDLFVPTTTAVTVTVARDSEPLKDQIQSMVDAYNAFGEILVALNDADNAADDGTGSLAGDPILRAIKQNLRNLLSGGSSTPGENISYLSDLGITFNLSGEMELDADKLDSQLSDNFESVITFFTADIENQSAYSEDARGLAGDVVSWISDQVASDGVIETRQTSTESEIDRYRDQLEQLDLRMEAIRSRYLTQFTAMEQIVDQFNSLQDSLKSQFDNMPFTSKNS